MQLLEDSIEALKVAVINAPTQPIYANNLGLSYFEAGDWENAI